MRCFVDRFCQDESGGTAIEYGMIAGLISLIIVTFVRSMGQTLMAVFTSIAAGFPS